MTKFRSEEADVNAPDYAAVIQRVDYRNIRARSFTVWVYDKNKPRMPEAEEPHARYECVSMLGPFKTFQVARVAADEMLEGAAQ